MNQMLISVIIPVYNCEKYLHHSLQSMLSQSSPHWEAICVDDGSTDSSLSILQAWAEKDARIRVFSQQNQGVSAARNRGLDEAKGDYALFLDCDDWWLPQTIERMATAQAEHPDSMIVSGIAHYYDDAEPVDQYPTRDFDENAPRDFAWTPDAIVKQHLTANTTLYSMNIIRGKQLRFALGIPLSEDGFFNMCYAMHTDRCYLIRDALYCYYQRAGSVTHNDARRKRPVTDFLNIIYLYIPYFTKLKELPFGKRRVWQLGVFRRIMKESYDIVNWLHDIRQDIAPEMEKARKQLIAQLPLSFKIELKLRKLLSLIRSI